MIETIQNILDTVDKKKVRSYCKKVKKCSFKSVKNMKNPTGNYTLWNEFDKLYCFKARILRERGELQETQLSSFIQRRMKSRGEK